MSPPLPLRADTLLRLLARHQRRDPEGGWARARDVGGASSSHHARTLERLVARQYAERRELTTGRRGYEYRITYLGQRYLTRHDARTVARAHAKEDHGHRRPHA